jgi:hypothetical protein
MLGAVPIHLPPAPIRSPAHYFLECAGLADLRARYPRVVAAAAAVPAVGGQAAMQALGNILHSCSRCTLGAPVGGVQRAASTGLVIQMSDR